MIEGFTQETGIPVTIHNGEDTGQRLSIVKAIAERIGATAELQFSDKLNHSGLWVSVWLKTDMH